MTLFVSHSDDGEVEAFYCNTLGLFHMEHGVLVHRDNHRFRIRLFGAGTDETKSVLGRQGGDWPLLTLFVADLQELTAKLSVARVRLDGDVVELPYGRQAVCFDPSGNRVAIFEYWHYRFPSEDDDI